MDEPKVNPEHALSVIQQQRDMFFNALTRVEIEKSGLVARVAELEAELAKLRSSDKPPEAD
jgi:hypothetical protein